MELPLHGTLRFDEAPLGVGDIFSREDLMDGRLSYRNWGDDGTNDNFIIDVTDGVHHVPIKLNVDIRAVDDESPTLAGTVVGGGGVLSIVLEVDENSGVTLTPDDLRASDPDTDDMLLTFSLEEPPYEGLILRAGQQAGQFTQVGVCV